MGKGMRSSRRNNRRGKKSNTKDNMAGFDGVVISPSAFSSQLTAASNMIVGSATVDSSNGTLTASSGGTSILNNYNHYRYRQLSFEWIPFSAPGDAKAGGQVYIAYIDNPEQMNTWLGMTATQAVAAIKLMRNTVVFNAWEKFTYRVPLTYRRPWFDVNLTVTAGADVYDRSTQGMVVFAAETVGATDTIGRWRTYARIVAHGYQAALST